MSGCSYKDYAKTKQEFARTESIRMQTQGVVIMEAFTLVMKQIGGGNDGDNYLINHVYYDSEGRKHELKVKDSSSGTNALMLSMQFMPVLERIYQQQQLQMEAPATAEDVAIKFLSQLPVLGAIWGFTEMGKSSGTTINGDVSTSSGSSVTGNGSYSVPSNYQDSYNTTTTTTSTNTDSTITTP